MVVNIHLKQRRCDCLLLTTILLYHIIIGTIILYMRQRRDVYRIRYESLRRRWLRSLKGEDEYYVV